jgi:hypothetical protein
LAGAAVVSPDREARPEQLARLAADQMLIASLGVAAPV